MNRPTNRGRLSIYTSITDFNLENIIKILNEALKIHRQNVLDMNFLIDYYLGNQNIYQKVKTVREDINNKMVINLANAAIRDVKGYTFGTPVVYSSRNLNSQKELSNINNANEFETKSSIDNDVAEDMLITGLGYRAIFPEKVISPDEEPFRYACVDPRNAFVIKSTEIGNKPVLAVLINKELMLNDNANSYDEIYVYTVYSEKQKWVFKANGKSFNISIDEYINPEKGGYVEMQVLNTLPIEEFRFNKWNLGFFEIVLDILDGINLMASDTLDDIEQKIRSKLILFGIDSRQLEEVEEIKDEYGNVLSTKTFNDKLKESEVIAFSGETGINQDAKFVNNTLEYNGVNEYREWLESMYYYILGLPERKARASGGQDTGNAVVLRDGWATLETVARLIEMNWLKSERNSLRRLLAILRTSGVIKNITSKDIDISIGRNKFDNLLVKVQAGQTMNSMNLFDPVDIVKTMDITTDPEEMVSRGEKYLKKKQKELNEQQIKLQETNLENEEQMNNETTTTNE